MDRMTILQLDSVNVVCRSHFLPILARLGPYDRDKLDRYLYRSGEHFEFLSHEASIVSQDLQPLLRHRARANAEGKWAAKAKVELGEYIDEVLAEVAEHGPRTVKTLSDPGDRTGPWWGHSNGKRALDTLYTVGRLAVRNRDKMFVTEYDLPERVFADGVLDRPEPDIDEARKELLMLGAASHGIGTATDLADYFRLRMPVARPLLAELVEEGKLEPVEVAGWDGPTYLHPEARRPRKIKTRALLSPFDPVVWFRPRAERLFDFHYRIEIYVPEPKRIYGYYVLPFLLDEALVARVDLKADRKVGALRVRGSFAEDGVDRDRVCVELAGALKEMSDWLGLDGVMVEPKGDLADQLAAVVD